MHKTALLDTANAEAAAIEKWIEKNRFASLQRTGRFFYQDVLARDPAAVEAIQSALNAMPSNYQRDLDSALLAVIAKAKLRGGGLLDTGSHPVSKKPDLLVAERTNGGGRFAGLQVNETWVYESEDSEELRALQRYAPIYATRNGIILRTRRTEGRIEVSRLPDDADTTAPNSKHKFHLMEVGSTKVLAGDRKDSTRKAASIYAARKGIKITSKTNRDGTITLTRTA